VVGKEERARHGVFVYTAALLHCLWLNHANRFAFDRSSRFLGRVARAARKTLRVVRKSTKHGAALACEEKPSRTGISGVMDMFRGAPLHAARCEGLNRSCWIRRRNIGLRRSENAHRPRRTVALPELSVTPDNQQVVVRTAKHFLAERHVGDCPHRFDAVAIDNEPGRPPVVRVHKDAFSPPMQMKRTRTSSRRG
jgi:hypothetical protein